MTEWIFAAPGAVSDFRNPLNWHAAMQREAEGIIQILVGSTLGKDPDLVTDEDIAAHRESLAYVDPTKTALPASSETVPVQAWGGFPRAVQRRAPWTEFPPIEGDADGNCRASWR